ncbi:AI-2E family transporter [Candidatus Blastococcus massiliensis]|uniref:AI-2E family transporter n=1 Tax=Candidatus Blastococcus massiliensis TaxID=1470358 RepID=UPI0004AC73B4|nr:AI-2E family transporter [Candidatus Blastococcus massiliensis]
MTTPAHDRRPYPLWLDRGAGIAARFLVILVAIGAVLWMALQVTLVVTAVVLGFAVVSMLWPVARWLRRHGWPPVLAAIVTVVFLLGSFALLAYFVVSQIIANIPGLVDAGAALVDTFTDWAADRPVAEESPLAREALNQLESTVGAVLDGLGSGVVAGVGALSNVATVLGIAIFFAIFALTGGDKLWWQFTGLLPERNREPATESFRAVMTTTGGWFYASTLTGLIDGVLIGAGLLVLGVPLAVPIGALTFVLGYIPLVGATLAGVAAVGVAFVAGGWSTALWALLIVLAVQQIEGNVLSPLLLSRAVNFPPLITLLLTTTAGLAFGIVGLFLAVPVVGAIVAAATTYRRSIDEAHEPASAEPDGEPAVLEPSDQPP